MLIVVVVGLRGVRAREEKGAGGAQLETHGRGVDVLDKRDDVAVSLRATLDGTLIKGRRLHLCATESL